MQCTRLAVGAASHQSPKLALQLQPGATSLPLPLLPTWLSVPPSDCMRPASAICCAESAGRGCKGQRAVEGRNKQRC